MYQQRSSPRSFNHSSTRPYVLISAQAPPTPAPLAMLRLITSSTFAETVLMFGHGRSAGFLALEDAAWAATSRSPASRRGSLRNSSGSAACEFPQRMDCGRLAFWRIARLARVLAGVSGTERHQTTRIRARLDLCRTSIVNRMGSLSRISFGDNNFCPKRVAASLRHWITSR